MSSRKPEDASQKSWVDSFTERMKKEREETEKATEESLESYERRPQSKAAVVEDPASLKSAAQAAEREPMSLF
jgi:hypothetical protein